MSENIDQYKEWNDKARKLLDTFGSNNEDDMKSRNKDVAALLKQIQADKNLYPDYDDLMEEYRAISTKAGWALVFSKNGSSKSEKSESKSESKQEIRECCQNLQQLKGKLRLAIGAVDPTASKDVRNAVLKEAEKKPVYLDKRQRIVDAIKELTPVPGTKAQVAKLQGLLEAGAKLEPNYDLAFAALKGLTSALDGGRKGAESFEKDLPTSLKAQLKASREEIAAYKAVAGIADASGVAEEEKQIRITLAKYDDASKDKKPGVAKSCVEELKQRTSELNGTRLGLEKLRDDVTGPKGLYPKLFPLVNGISEWAPVSVMMTINPPYLEAKALAGSQQYAAAKEAFTKIEANIKQTEKTYSELFQSWTKIDEELTTKQKGTAERAEKTGNDTLILIASKIETSIGVVRGKFVPARDYQGALDFVKDAKLVADLDALLKLLTAAEKGGKVEPKFEGVELTFQIELGKLKQEVEPAVAKVGENLGKLEKAGGLTTPYDSRLDTIKRNWAISCGPVGDMSLGVPERQKVLSTLIVSQKDVVSELGKLATEIEDLFKPKGKLNESISEKVKADEAGAFEEAQAEVEKALAYLADFGLPDSDPLMAEEPALAAIRQAYADWVKAPERDGPAMGRLAKVQSDADAKKTKIEKKLAADRKAAQETAKKLNKSIGVMVEAHADYKPYFGSLQDKITECLGMASSTIPSVLLEGTQKLAVLEGEITKMEKELKSTATGTENFKAVEAKIKELQKKLDGTDLKDYQELSQKTLSTRLEKVIPATLHPLSPKEALAKLAEFETEVQEAIDRATTAKQARKTLESNASQAEEDLKKIKSTCPNLYESLSKRVTKAGTAPKGDEARALLEISSIQILIKSAGDTKKGAIMEKKVVRDKLEDERAAAEFKGAKAVFEKNVKKKADDKRSEFTSLLGLKVSEECNTEAYDQMIATYNEAEKLGASDPAGGINKLKQATALARYFLANPMNPAATARKELKRLNESWKNSVSGYLKNLAALKGKIVTEGSKDPSVGPDAAKEAAAKLEILARLFNASVFDAGTEMLSVPAKALTEIEPRRSEKEACLMVVRRLERVIAEHAVLKKAIDNPILPLPVKPLSNALRGLNGALLAS